MKVPAKGPSRFLSQEDLPTPIVAVMSHVTLEVLKSARGADKKFILHFQSGSPKPLKLNITNQRVIIGVHGDESDNWRGKPIEIYWDATVPMGGEIVGGVRVRIPAAPKQLPPPAPVPALKPAQTPSPSIDERHARVMAGYRAAKTVQYLDQWAVYASKLPFLKEHLAEQQALYEARLAELAPVPISA